MIVELLISKALQNVEQLPTTGQFCQTQLWQSGQLELTIQRLATYGYQISKATELLRIATHCIALREETTILYASASSSELLHDLCKGHEISTIEQA